MKNPQVLLAIAVLTGLLWPAASVAGDALEPADPPSRREAGRWRVLGGPEREEGEPVRIVADSGDALTLLVEHRRGTAMRHFAPVRLPAELSFDFQSTFDPEASEIPTELFGTGDFRIFVGSSGDSPDDLGTYEGFQLRIFPHLADSPIRRLTGEESHTATSLWIRNIEAARRTNSDGHSHSGLMSDACQNRGRDNGRHNCGWTRVLLATGGFGLKNGESTRISFELQNDSVKIEAGEWRMDYPLEPSQLRLDRIDTLAIGHTNISRGYGTVTIGDLAVRPL